MSNENNINIFALIVLFSSMAPMAAEIYIPSLPYISQDLHTSKNIVQLTITYFLFGMATTGIIFGYISDYVGRRPILISTSIIGLIGTFICFIAPDIYWLISGRILQGAGFSGVSGIGRAILRDKIRGVDAAKYAAYLAMATALIIDLTPFFGGILQQYFSWRFIFLFLLLYNGFVIYFSYNYIETSISNTEKISWLGLIYTCKKILQNKSYFQFNLIVAVSYALFMAYLTVASFIVQDTLNLSPAWFGTLTLSFSLIYISCCFINGQLLKKISIFSLTKFGLWLMLFSGILLLIVGFFFKLTIILFCISILPMFIGSAFSWSNTDSLAYMDLKENFGIASALAITIRLTLGFLLTGFISLFNPSSTIPLGATFCLLCLVCLILINPYNKFTHNINTPFL
ncbi:MAG TPA: MFS transporter [Burkholderiales bacterium]|nr:MFS transporter [Burkholderiales bacterium]